MASQEGNLVKAFFDNILQEATLSGSVEMGNLQTEISTVGRMLQKILADGLGAKEATADGISELEKKLANVLENAENKEPLERIMGLIKQLKVELAMQNEDEASAMKSKESGASAMKSKEGVADWAKVVKQMVERDELDEEKVVEAIYKSKKEEYKAIVSNGLEGLQGQLTNNNNMLGEVFQAVARVAELASRVPGADPWLQCKYRIYDCNAVLFENVTSIEQLKKVEEFLNELLERIKGLNKQPKEKLAMQSNEGGAPDLKRKGDENDTLSRWKDEVRKVYPDWADEISLKRVKMGDKEINKGVHPNLEKEYDRPGKVIEAIKSHLSKNLSKNV